MATKIISIDAGKTPQQRADDWLRSTDVRFLACMGFGHAFPKLKPQGNRRGTPRGIIMRGFADGSRELELTCRDCGTKRYIGLAPGASIAFPQRRYNYDRPPGYSRPKGTYALLPKHVVATECARRWEEEQALPTGGEDLGRLAVKFSDGP